MTHQFSIVENFVPSTLAEKQFSLVSISWFRTIKSAYMSLIRAYVCAMSPTRIWTKKVIFIRQHAARLTLSSLSQDNSSWQYASYPLGNIFSFFIFSFMLITPVIVKMWRFRVVYAHYCHFLVFSWPFLSLQIFILFTRHNIILCCVCLCLFIFGFRFV